MINTSRRAVSGPLAAALGVWLAASPAAAAPADGDADAPAGTDPAAGSTLRPGQAYMGWHDDTTTSDQPTSAPAGTAADESVEPAAAGPVYGIDVSAWQGDVDWAYWWSQGFRFAYVKATEGTYYQNTNFYQQYVGSYNQGFIRGSYHFARPDTTSGATQAEYFVAHGGGWSPDGRTLPGVLDIEFNPYGENCYGLSDSAMVSWVADFVDTYRELTGRDAVIYTNTYWWQDCTGNSSAFGSTDPLWVANYSDSTPPLPAGWSFYTFHQYTSTPLDKDKFNGSYDRLQVLANP